MRVVLAIVLVCLVALVWRPPVALLDHAISHASDGRVRLALAQGSLWRGSGTLAISDGEGVRPLRHIAWHLRSDLLGAALHLALSEHGHQQARISLTPTGVEFEIARLELPVRLLASASSHPVARAGWSGKLITSSPGMSCDWAAHCSGRIDLLWEDVRLAIVPDRHLGDHAIALTAEGERIAAQVSTLRGDLRIEGTGVLGKAQQPSFRARIEGDPEIVDRLPNVMGRNARLTGTPGQADIVLP